MQRLVSPLCIFRNAFVSPLPSFPIPRDRCLLSEMCSTLFALCRTSQGQALALYVRHFTQARLFQNKPGRKRTIFPFFKQNFLNFILFLIEI